MTLLLALLTAPLPAEPTGTTTLARLPAAEVHLQRCALRATDAEAKGGPAQVVEVWADCAMEADTDALRGLLPELEGLRLLAELERDHGPMRAADPTRFARLSLITMADAPEARFPPSALQEAWLQLLHDPDAKQELAEVRSVSLRWTAEPSVDPALQEAITAHARRYIGDMGFKVAPTGSAEEGRAHILVRAQASVESLAPEVVDGRGRLYVEQVSLSAKPVKFKARDDMGEALSAASQATHAAAEAARAQAAQGAAEAFAHALLREVAREVFAGRPPPVSP